MLGIKTSIINNDLFAGVTLYLSSQKPIKNIKKPDIKNIIKSEISLK